MKPTKRIIEEVTKKAEEMNVDVKEAISTLNYCSMAMYKAIGAEGVVKSARPRTPEKQDLIKETEKAILIKTKSPKYNHVIEDYPAIEVWCPKSLIENGRVPDWFIRKSLSNN